MGTLREILSRKGWFVHTIPATQTVLDAVDLMNRHRVGALVVTEGDRLVGMFTERDVLRRVVSHPRTPDVIAVAEVMTAEIIQCSPETPIEEAGRIMKDRRVRHIPVCDSRGSLVGLVSIGDVNAYHISQQQTTIQQLEEYVYSGV